MSTRKLSKTRKNDPFFERECQKYEIPLPSREYTMQLLQDTTGVDLAGIVGGLGKKESIKADAE